MRPRPHRAVRSVSVAFLLLLVSMPARDASATASEVVPLLLHHTRDPTRRNKPVAPVPPAAKTGQYAGTARKPRDHCTCIGMGPAATEDGIGALVAQTSDGEGNEDYRVIFVPPRQVTPGETRRPVYYPLEGTPRLVAPQLSPEYGPFWADDEPTAPIGYVVEESPESFLAEGREKMLEGTTSATTSSSATSRIGQKNFTTHAYYDGSYALMSAYLGIAEATCSARMYNYPRSLVNPETGERGKALLTIQEISRIMLERCETARCAVLMGGRTAEKYGFYSTFEVDDSGEALTITDGTETWLFHILGDDTGGGAVWAAEKLEDDHFAVIANMFVIREMDLENSDKFLYSKNMVKIAEKYGWYSATSDAGRFDFTKIFSAGEYAHPYYSARRAWRMLSHANPALGLDPLLGYNTSFPTYPSSVPVAKKLKREDVFGFYRDHYEGTPFDLTKGVAAGGYGNPMRYAEGASEARYPYGAWERSIDIYRTTMTHVAEVAKTSTSGREGAAVETTLWYAPARATASIFVPLFLRNTTTSSPKELRAGSGWEVNPESLWWAATAIGNWMDLRYGMIRADVSEYQNDIEPRLIAFAEDWWKEARKTKTTGKEMSTTTEEWHSLISSVTSAHWQLFYKLMAKYQNGYVMVNKTAGHEDRDVNPHRHLKSAGAEGHLREQEVDNARLENKGDIEAEALGYPREWLDIVNYGSLDNKTFIARNLRDQFDAMRAQLKQYQKQAEEILAGQSKSADEVKLLWM